MQRNGHEALNGQTPALPAASDWNHLAIAATQPNSQVVASAKPQIKLPEIEDAVALIDKHMDLPKELVHGVLHAGGKMVIGGGSKSFKTWLLSDLALSVSIGGDWLGFETTKGQVLYINLEIQPAFFGKRLREIASAKSIELVAGMLHVWNLRGYAADMSSLSSMILERVGQQYSMIVVDPIYKVLGSRDENKAGDIAGLLNELERLAVQSTAAVVFGAHFSKGNQAGKESMDRIGGSGVFARDPDSILVLTKHVEDDAFVVDATLRNHPPVSPFVVRWQHPLMRRDEELGPTKLKQAGGRAKQHTVNDLLAIFDGGPASASQLERMAMDQTGMSGSTFYRLFRELKATKKVVKSPEHHGRWIRA